MYGNEANRISIIAYSILIEVAGHMKPEQKQQVYDLLLMPIVCDKNTEKI